MSNTASVYIVMGVSGVGKTTVALGLAAACDGVFLEADDFHPAVNVAHMTAGKPLNDDMRWPWLEILCAAINDRRDAQPDKPVFVTCSALKASYRDFIRARVPAMRIIYLHAPEDVLRARMNARENHYMPSSLLDSQLDTLEDPRSEPDCLTVDAQNDTPDVINRAVAIVQTASLEND